MSMRKIEDWLNMLPPPYKERALENLYLSNWNNANKLADTAASALSTAFNWGKSPEGVNYWLNVMDLLEDEAFVHNNMLKDE